MANTRNRKPDNTNKTNFWTRKTTLIPIFAFSTMTAIVGKDLFIDAPNNAPQSAPSSNVAQAPAPDAVQTPPPAPALPPPEAVPALPPPPPPPEADPFSLDPAAQNNFLYSLGVSESANDYGRPNFAGCLGRWQFCPEEIGGPGFGKYNSNRGAWLQDAPYQNEQMEAYTRNHWNDIVRLGLTRFLGQTISSSRGPVFVTPAAMLGGSHLVGIGRLQMFLESGGRANMPDGGGTTPADYMIRFKDTKVPDDWVRMPDVQTAAAVQRAPGPVV